MSTKKKKILFCQKPQTAFCVNLTSNPRLLPSAQLPQRTQPCIQESVSHGIQTGTTGTVPAQRNVSHERKFPWPASPTALAQSSQLRWRPNATRGSMPLGLEASSSGGFLIYCSGYAARGCPGCCVVAGVRTLLPLREGKPRVLQCSLTRLGRGSFASKAAGLQGSQSVRDLVTEGCRAMIQPTKIMILWAASFSKLRQKSCFTTGSERSLRTQGHLHSRVRAQNGRAPLRAGLLRVVQETCS